MKKVVLVLCLGLMGCNPYNVASDNILDPHNPIYKLLQILKAVNQFNSTPTSADTTAPSALSYVGTPYTFTVGTGITTILPTVTGKVTACNSTPSLPAGLVLNSTVCSISGIPTTAQAETNYTITASNEFGNTAATISIAINVENTSPIPGSFGAITSANITTSSLTLNWTKATDNISSPESLQYKVVRSSSDNINTVTDAEINGTLVLDWTTDIATANASGLSVNTTYFFNVLVKDAVGNKGIYTAMSRMLGYTIGGTISGLTASNLILHNNLADSLTIASGSTNYTFSTRLASGTAYSVTITSRPTGLSCYVSNASGTAIANVSNISITCTSVTETYSWGTFTDNFNGTVSFVGVSGTFGGNTYPSQTLTFMKCSQGQVWNSTTNNCDGGAGTYQYCSEYNNSCDDGTTLNGSGSSQVYTTCNSIGTYATKTGWRVPTKNELKTLIHCTNKSMPTDYPNVTCFCGNGNFISPTISNLFPKTIAGDYRSSTSYSSGDAWFIVFSNGTVSAHNKLGNDAVRCVTTP